MGIEVRDAVPGDAPRLVVLLDELGYRVAPKRVPGELRVDGTNVFVADEDGLVVGLLAMHTRRHFQRAALVSSIDALVVTKSHRGRGIGALLVDHAVEVATGLGAVLVDVNSGVKRVGARRFYERMGFDLASYHFRRHLPDRPASPPEIA